MSAAQKQSEPKYRFLKVLLNNKEIRERGQEIARKVREIVKLKADLDSIKAEISSKIKKLNAEINHISGVVDAKCEYRDVEVREFRDYQTATVFIRRMDTFDIIEERAMTSRELQQELNLQPEEETEAAPDEQPLQHADVEDGSISTEEIETDSARLPVTEDLCVRCRMDPATRSIFVEGQDDPIRFCVPCAIEAGHIEPDVKPASESVAVNHNA